MPAKSSWNNRYPLAAYLYFLPHCNFLSRQPPLPPSNNVEEKDENVPRHVMHFSTSFLHLHLFYNHITTLYRGGGERVHRQVEHGVPTLLAGIVDFLKNSRLNSHKNALNQCKTLKYNETKPFFQRITSSFS